MEILPTIVQDFRTLKSLADKAIAQVPDRDLHWQPDKESNSIAVIMKHLSGNMMSRWTDFLTTDGEKPSRDRDAEFESENASRDQLLTQWESGWARLFHTLDGLTESDLSRTIIIRGQAQSVVEAITRQIGHYGYHIGQIVYVAKHLRSEEWKNLSIPRGKSADYYRRGR